MVKNTGKICCHLYKFNGFEPNKQVTVAIFQKAFNLFLKLQKPVHYPTPRQPSYFSVVEKNMVVVLIDVLAERHKQAVIQSTTSNVIYYFHTEEHPSDMEVVF